MFFRATGIKAEIAFIHLSIKEEEVESIISNMLTFSYPCPWDASSVSELSSGLVI